MSDIEAVKLVLLALALLALPWLVDKLFGRDTFITIVGVVALVGMVLVLLGVMAGPEAGRWGH